jgi:fermentation-respiration switch protein FrsA (DUF1100 family)
MAELPGAAEMGETPKKPKAPWPRRLAWFCVRLCIYYVVIVAVLLALENFLVYPATSAAADWQQPFGHTAEDVELHSADGTRLHAWWCPYPDAKNIILFAHGNGGNLSHRTWGIQQLQQVLGASVLIFDYPGYGKSEGRPSEAGCYAAADAAYDWLVSTQKVPAERILLYGESLGGGVMVDLASRRPHRALILDRTFSSLPDVAGSRYFFLPTHLLMRNRYDSVGKIGKCHRPVFSMHGDVDRVIPYRLGRRLFEAANEPKRFHDMPGVDHNDMLPATSLVALRDFLAEQAP